VRFTGRRPHDRIKGRGHSTAAKRCNRGYSAMVSDKFFIYDSFGSVTDENLLEVFEYAYRRYNCRVFLADNLMTMVLTGERPRFLPQARADSWQTERLCSYLRRSCPPGGSSQEGRRGGLQNWTYRAARRLRTGQDNVFGPLPMQAQRQR